jgi:ribosomal protein S18 acetylase RimI-like enzyme
MSDAARTLGIEIRLAETGDAAAISSLLLQSFEEYKPLYTEEGFAATTPNAEAVIDRLREGPVWIALANNVAVGTASAVLKGESLYVRGMAVLPSTRGQRIGELLLRRINEHAISQNCKRMVLSTTPFLDRAIRLYERFGFQRTSEGPHDLFGTPLFTMERAVGRTI